MILKLLNLSRLKKRVTAQTIDAFSLLFAFLLGLSLRLGEVYIPSSPYVWGCLLFCIVFTIIFGEKIGVYKTVVRFFGNQNVVSICSMVFASAVVMSLCLFFLSIPLPRSTPIIYASLGIMFMLGSRFSLRLLFQHYAKEQLGEPVIIYGAGSAGNQLAISLKQDNRYMPIAFIDDNAKLHGRRLQGIEVSPPESIDRLVNDYNVKRILLAIANIPSERRKEIYEQFEHLPVKVKTIPAYSQIVSGELTIENLRDVNVEDLLGRTPVAPVTELMDKCIKNKVVMVTGAGGSIGSELCRQIIKLQPKTLVLFENSEFSLYSIHKELVSLVESEMKAPNSDWIVPIIGNVLDSKLLDDVFATYSVNTVYHAAAYKHVPLVEQNIVEGVKNNVLGTYQVAQKALQHQVENMVLISTDKAVRPTNVMGASKRVAEFALQALATLKSNTCFSMVRFGNVLGSSGSVVPLFKDQISNGGPLTVTHPDITRYFMTIPEAAQLVIQAGALAKGGEVFVLDMGKPVKILDLAKKMIRLTGYSDDPASERFMDIKFTGLRPGEKLYEELLVDDNALGTKHSRIMCAKENYLEVKELEALVSSIELAIERREASAVRDLLLQAPTGFNPMSENVDLVSTAPSKSSNQSQLH
ncbi:polysaccharide biosynthesis protein [Paraneptunicella aestuarii]|uniref:polysaccharide biosynthesis protein n=1 Tax=Paraneptunicella aestuarii TaxID=2831148 RepID=UPI001E5D47AD|nr:nucleoside-diphosphate sugar epimerase/dehydratase [Paraneptunicella aestuarii]UAA39667.1 polysaccharide biosynthesis protein [Paraneptunicella aestuarii]